MSESGVSFAQYAENGLSFRLSYAIQVYVDVVGVLESLVVRFVEGLDS